MDTLFAAKWLSLECPRYEVWRSPSIEEMEGKMSEQAPLPTLSNPFSTATDRSDIPPVPEESNQAEWKYNQAGSGPQPWRRYPQRYFC